MSVERVNRSRSERIAQLTFFVFLTALAGFGAWSAIEAALAHWWIWVFAAPAAILTLVLAAYCVSLVRAWRRAAA